MMNTIKIDVATINNEEKDKLILEEKQKGNSDFEIGKKYRVSYKYIEELITRKKGVNINNFHKKKLIKNLGPKDFQMQESTVWSFKQRGAWATHSGEYRGNWSPYIPRNIILKYSKQGDLVLDYFCGAGTTAVEAKLLGRKCIALDINPHAVELSKDNSNFNNQLKEVYEPAISTGDARNLSNIEDNSIDLICAHPPYANIIQYTDNKKDDLSFLDINDFLKEMEKVAQESFRVLKPGHQCAILIGDTRRKKHVIPLGFELIDVFLRAGFKLRELIIKRQHNCKTTGFWFNNSIKYNFLLLAHEYLPVFEKPKQKPMTKSLVYENCENLFPYLTIPKIKEKINSIETATVWLFPSKDFGEYLNKNIISRYSPRNNYLVYNFSEQFNEDSKLVEKKKIDLLYLKFPTRRKDLINIDEYEKDIIKLIYKELDHIETKGFIVIQTKDLRTQNGHIIPLAKRLQELIKDDRLWLKEIIVATIEKSNIVNNNKSIDKFDNEYLSIHHCYLLVYEKVK
ncbi:MAG: DNA methyltransferase [Candidatus Caldatribacteriota bacterium]|nr:DNA methyltransferase [Candidatus Caldatribacteriota bacterium]